MCAVGMACGSVVGDDWLWPVVAVRCLQQPQRFKRSVLLFGRFRWFIAPPSVLRRQSCKQTRHSSQPPHCTVPIIRRFMQCGMCEELQHGSGNTKGGKLSVDSGICARWTCVPRNLGCTMLARVQTVACFGLVCYFGPSITEVNQIVDGRTLRNSFTATL